VLQGKGELVVVCVSWLFGLGWGGAHQAEGRVVARWIGLLLRMAGRRDSWDVCCIEDASMGPGNGTVPAPQQLQLVCVSGGAVLSAGCCCSTATAAAGRSHRCTPLHTRLVTSSSSTVRYSNTATRQLCGRAGRLSAGAAACLVME
jgi:hypothetical protein